MTIAQIVIVAICLVLALLTIPAAYLIRKSEMGQLSYKRVGGLRFLRIGRLSISMSIAKNPLTAAQKANRAAWRKESREELHYNARIGRAVRYAELKERIRQNDAERELEAFLAAGWEADESHPANWH